MSQPNMGKGSIVTRLGRACCTATGLGVLLGGMAWAGDTDPQWVWSDERTNESYYNHTISIGNWGTQVFCDTGYLTQRTMLYSAFDDEGDSAWEHYDSTIAFNRMVASADHADVHAVWRQEVGQTSTDRVARVYIYRSDSSTPLQANNVYSFDDTESGNGKGSCHVSADGRWVVATTSVLNDVQIARFDTTGSSPNVPRFETVVGRFGPTSVTALSSDGKRLYMGGAMSGTVIDLFTGATLFDSLYHFGAETGGHAFSGDGKTIVVPKGGKTVIYRQSGGTFSELTDFDPFPTNDLITPRAHAISENGDIVVASYVEGPQLVRAHIFAWRVSTGQQLLHHQQNGSGSLDNLPDSIAISDKGERFVVGLYGDEAGISPEILVFQSSYAGANYHLRGSFHRPGSVFAIGLSSDGNHLAVSGRTSHANSVNGSKLVESFDLGTDFRAHGSPRQGRNLEFEFIPGVQAQRGYLLSSGSLGSTSFGFGELHLSRQGLRLAAMGPPDSTGSMSCNHHLTAPVGSTTYFQAYALGPRQLSEDWLPVTVLP